MSNQQTIPRGGCLCGAIKYQLTKPLATFYFCHCEQCRKVTGSGFAANIITETDGIEWLSGAELLNHYEHPSREFSKTFCTQCGSGLPHINKSKTALVVPAGSLDQPPNIKPAANLFTDEQAEWLQVGLEATPFQGFPDDSEL